MKASLEFLYGVMDSGKSLSLLTRAYNAEQAGKTVYVTTSKDRSGSARISSRVGLSRECFEYDEYTSFWNHLLGSTYDQVYVDEAQFLIESQVEDLCWAVDSMNINVFCYGLLNDFRTNMFPGSKRLVELADRITKLQNCALCWCGNPGQVNARHENHEVIFEGPQILVGDVEDSTGYVVLCRQHFWKGESGL